MFGKRIGFLKFEADVIDKETGKKVSSYILVFYIVMVWFGVWIACGAFVSSFSLHWWP